MQAGRSDQVQTGDLTLSVAGNLFICPRLFTCISANVLTYNALEETGQIAELRQTLTRSDFGS